MNKIKVLGTLIFVLSIILAFLFNYISMQNKENTVSLSTIHEQKSYTQEISKSVLYLYKNRGSSPQELDRNIENFLANMKHKKDDSSQHAALIVLWNEFYAVVQKFKKEREITTAYSSIIVDKLVNDIYTKNQELIVAFDKLIHSKQKYYDQTMEGYKNIESILFFIVVVLLIYLFTQVHEIIAFIQKFSSTSKSIIQKASIEGLQPMKISKSDGTLKEATQNFNHLVEKIDKAIVYSQESITHTTMALEEVEQNIEDFITLLSQMQDGDSDTLSQKEDAVIDSLETLMNLRDRLEYLNEDLDKLTSSK